MVHVFAGATAGVAGALQGMQRDLSFGCAYRCSNASHLVIVWYPHNPQGSTAKAGLAQRGDRSRHESNAGRADVWRNSEEVIRSTVIEMWKGSPLEMVSFGEFSTSLSTVLCGRGPCASYRLGKGLTSPSPKLRGRLRWSNYRSGGI